ncbi:sodium:solute symporter family transporter [Mucisphaera calidilacus]|uniref:Sodium/glucose cotransporter n=1 Tax=Mucisphaera calidilacus TaxID=2527982 RepID=A0A518C176_9BACT|nr:hypothetical protein [Mucisphaera calidilacus]QDU72986.1 Sodium/glucose cotransporter [Mucisphaera calidilacus]
MTDYLPLIAQAEPGSIVGAFTWIDWLVVFGYLVVTTVLGGVLAGKQSSVKDFFLGGKKMPWYAVAGSSIATEISAVTFVGAPFIVFGPGGNFAYLQLGLVGVLMARLIVAFVLVPAYYKHEIYSPYDYMGNQLGESAKWVTTALFSLGGVLGQSARVYLTAIILELVMAEQLGALESATGIPPVVASIAIIGLISIIWTIMGGIATVIWTDVILFLVFVLGGIIALVTIVSELPGGVEQMMTVADEANKWQLWDLEWSAVKPYTIYTAAFASVFGNVGVYGTDQLMAQRIFCCKDQREAKIAVMAAYAGQIITAMMLAVGAGLYVFYQEFPLVGDALARYEAEPNRIFPIFILSELPTGVTGLIIAGIFAAAISSLDSILAALSQTTMSVTYLRWRQKKGDDIEEHGAEAVFISRLLVVFWGVVLCLAAYVVYVVQQEGKLPILDLALALASYSVGSLLAAFLLGFLPLRVSGYGLVFSAPLSVMTIFAIVWHDQAWAQTVAWAFGSILLATWLYAASMRTDLQVQIRTVLKTPVLALGVALMIWLTYSGAVNYQDIVITRIQSLPDGSITADEVQQAYVNKREQLAALGIQLKDDAFDRDDEIGQQQLTDSAFVQATLVLEQLGVPKIDTEMRSSLRISELGASLYYSALSSRYESSQKNVVFDLRHAMNNQDEMKASEAFSAYVETQLAAREIEPTEELIEEIRRTQLTDEGLVLFLRSQLIPLGMDIELASLRGTLAWPWWSVVGFFVAFIFGYLLADPRDPALAKASA